VIWEVYSTIIWHHSIVAHMLDSYLTFLIILKLGCKMVIFLLWGWITI